MLAKRNIPIFIVILILTLSMPVEADPRRQGTDCAAQKEIPQAECDCLINLYNSTDGPNWSDSPGSGWNQNNSPGTWTGVTVSNGHVTIIERGSKNLKGTIPDLRDLTSLYYLYLNNNQLSGTIHELGNLTNLYRLSLADNLLTGTVPDLSALANLQHLYLNNNQLSGSFPS